MALIWFFIIFLSVIVLLFCNPELVISEMLSASASAVELIINLVGIYAVWLGILNILDKSGLANKLSRVLSPLIKRLFRTNNPDAIKYISINMSSNILGLGNASTPSGIKAMQTLDDKSGKITFPGIMLIVINSVSIQLLPTTIIGLRQNAGSSSPSDIILPTILSSILTCVVAILLVFMFSKLFKRRVK